MRSHPRKSILIDTSHDSEEYKNRYNLPDIAETRDGFIFHPKANDWAILTNSNRLNFCFDDLFVSDQLKISYKRFVIAKLRSDNPKTAYAYYQHARYLLQHIGRYDQESQTISSVHLINYRGSLQIRHLYRSTAANDAVRAWAGLGIPGIDDGAYITATEMPRHNNPRALAVRLRCPHQGAYSNLEYDGLYRALHTAFADGVISIDNYGLCLLSGAISPRPVQIASLLVGDLKVGVGPLGKTYLLRVPRAKQRGGGYRTHFSDRPLVQEIGMVIEAQAQLVREQARNCGLVDPDQAPLFPAVHVSGTFFESKAVPARPTNASIAMRIKNVMGGLGVRSERTGKAINVNATRARRTAGTRAAQEGKSLAEIASILDHSSLTAAKSYVEARSELLQRIDKKLAILLAPMAQRFAGTVIARRNDQGDAVHRAVLGNVEDGGGPINVGGCGKRAYCGLGTPTACYTCRLFYPWLDGPHELMLDHLLEKRRRMASDGSVIVAATLDETILACAEVVRQCSARSSELGHHPRG